MEVEVSVCRMGNRIYYILQQSSLDCHAAGHGHEKNEHSARPCTDGATFHTIHTSEMRL